MRQLRRRQAFGSFLWVSQKQHGTLSGMRYRTAAYWRQNSNVGGSKQQVVFEVNDLASKPPILSKRSLPHLGIYDFFFYLATTEWIAKSPAQCLRVEWTPKCVDLRRSQRTWSVCSTSALQLLWQMSAYLSSQTNKTKNSRQMLDDEQLCHWFYSEKLQCISRAYKRQIYYCWRVVHCELCGGIFSIHMIDIWRIHLILYTTQ